MLEPGSFVNYSSGEIDVRNLYPVQGFKSDTRSPDNLVRGVSAQLVSILPGLTIALRKVLEYDEDSYALQITGTPKDFAVLGRSDIGYQITLSIYPRVDEGQKDT